MSRIMTSLCQSHISQFLDNLGAHELFQEYILQLCVDDY